MSELSPPVSKAGKPLTSNILDHRCETCDVVNDPVCCLVPGCVEKEFKKCEKVKTELFTPYTRSTGSTGSHWIPLDARPRTTQKTPRSLMLQSAKEEASSCRDCSNWGKCVSWSESSECSYCVTDSCPVKLDPGCCLHPVCKSRKPALCKWTDEI